MKPLPLTLRGATRAKLEKKEAKGREGTIPEERSSEEKRRKPSVRGDDVLPAIS